MRSKALCLTLLPFFACGNIKNISRLLAGEERKI
nr:MAG TPA: hypothetical protein [Bacteriophage sp.]